jgi:hypothetical protein
VLKPYEIVAIEEARFDPETGLAYVVVRHLQGDRVSGTVDVKVTIGGNIPGEEKKMKRGRIQDWYVRYTVPPPLKIPVSVRLNGLDTATIPHEIQTGPDAAAASPGAGAPGGGGAPK